MLTGLARDAGAAVMLHYASTSPAGTPASKADGSPVTLADYDSHQVIMDGLERWWPSIPVISEEAELPSYEARRHWRRFWLVDPLDGTKEFISRNGEFTVNIALIDEGEPVLGVIFAPALDLMYEAGKGLGAWRTGVSGSRVEVSHTRPEAGQPLRVVESRSHGSPALEEYLRTLEVAERIRVGSSLKFCYVADGQADIYPRMGHTMEWDVAAGDCVYRNSSQRGQHQSPLTYNTPGLRNDPFVLGGPVRMGAPPPRLVAGPAADNRGSV